jgi:hypothetical protein
MQVQPFEVGAEKWRTKVATNGVLADGAVAPIGLWSGRTLYLLFNFTILLLNPLFNPNRYG